MSSSDQYWDPSNGPSTYVVSEYCWYANFRRNVPDPYKVTFLDGEPVRLRSMSESSSDSAFITHEVSSPYFYTIYWDASHGGNPGLFGASIDEMESKDNPVCFSDGSVIFRLKIEMKSRADIPWSGGAYYYWY